MEGRSAFWKGGSENRAGFMTLALPPGHLPTLHPHTAKAASHGESRSDAGGAFGNMMEPGRRFKSKTCRGGPRRDL